MGTSSRLKAIKQRRVVNPTHFSSSNAKRFSNELAAQHRIVVRVLAAKRLLASDPVSGTSDACAAVWCSRLDDTRSGRAEMQRSAACPGSVDPRWESGNEFCFAVAIDAPEDINEGCVVVSLRDEQVYVAEAVDASRQEDAIYELGEAVLPFRDLFYRGKAMAGTRTVQLTAQWLQLRRAPGMVRVAGQVLVSAVFFFARGTSRQAFETDIARISGTENLVEDEIPEDRATTPKTPHVFELPNTPVFDIRGLAPSLDLGEMLRTPRRKPSDTTTVSPRAHLQRLRRAANHAEKSLLRSSPLARETMQTSLRDRIRDALVGLRERDSRAASAGALWAELRNADDQRALIFIDEILGLRQTATAGGIASGVLTDELAPVSARRQTLALLAAVAVSHPRACVPRLRAALRTVALASQSGGGPTSVFSLECAQVAGGLARAVFPHAAVARGSCVAGDADFVVGALITPFTLMLSRPRARGRRSVAACVAAVIGASSGPCTVWLERSAAKRPSRTRPASVVEDLRRHLASRGISLVGNAMTPLPNCTGMVIHCGESEMARDLLSALEFRDALPHDWHLDADMMLRFENDGDAQNQGQLRRGLSDEHESLAAFILAVWSPVSLE